MATVFTTILNMSLTASIIILIVLMARLCLKKAPKIYSYLLWAVVLFRLLCPVSFSLPVSVLAPVSDASTTAGTSYTASMEYISVPERPSAAPATPDLGHGENNVPADVPVPEVPAAVVAPQQAAKKPAGEIALAVLGWLWVVGVAAVLGFTTWQTFLLKRKLDTAFIIRGNIFESEQIDTAFILGVFNPKIYLPLDLPFDIQKAVVAHEQTHQRRGDHIVKLVSYLVLAVHWFNPLVWLSFKLMCDDMEKSCDEAVLREMNNRGYSMKSIKKAYGNMLLVLGGGKQHIFSPVSFAENSTKSRVKNVVAYNRIARNMGVGLAVVCVLVALLCVVNPTGAVAATVSDADVSSGEEVEEVTEYGSAENVSSEVEHDPDAVQLNIGGYTFSSDTVELDLSGRIIRGDELTVLTKCTRLEKLVVEEVYEDSVDLSILSQIPTLKALTLSYNCPFPDDLAFLAECESLEEFSSLLNSSTEEDYAELRVLKQVPNLKRFSLRATNAVDNLFFLSGCNQLEELQLNCEIADGESCSVISQLPELRKLEFNVSDTSEEDTIDYSFLGNCKNLEELNVFAQDAEVFESLNLPNIKRLSVAADDSLSFLSGFNNLEELELLVFNFKGDLSALSRLTSLKKLDLQLLITDLSILESNEESSYFSDWSVLSGLTELTELRIVADHTYMRDVSFTENMEHLQVFSYEGYPHTIGSIRHLDGKTILRELTLPEMEIEDGYFPQGLVNLETLHINATPAMGENISSCSKLRSISGSLTGSSIDFSQLERIERIDGIYLDTPESCIAVARLPMLRELTASFEEDEWLKYLENADELRALVLPHTVDASHIPSIAKLEYLEIKNDWVTNISGVANLGNLRFLNLDECTQLSDITPLAGHPSLEMLAMKNCNVSDVTPLATADKLIFADFEGNNISDISALYGHKGLGSGEEFNPVGTFYGRMTAESVITGITSPAIIFYLNYEIPDEQIIELYNSLEHHCDVIAATLDIPYEIKTD